LKRFWWMFGAKMEACWHQNRWKIDTNCEKRFLDKSCSRCSGGLIREVPGVEVGSKNPSKNDQKMKSTWEGILASIFNGFWGILGGKLGGKIEPRGTKNGIEKTMKKWRATKWPKGRNTDPLHRFTPGNLVPGEVPPFKAGQSSGVPVTRRLASKVL